MSSATPLRVQISRTKGSRLPPNTTIVDRRSIWGNPFNATQGYVAFGLCLPIPLVKLHEPPSLGRCLDLYTAYLRGRVDADPLFLAPLRGKNLACWCAPGAPCHADVLLRLANEATA